MCLKIILNFISVVSSIFNIHIYYRRGFSVNQFNIIVDCDNSSLVPKLHRWLNSASGEALGCHSYR